MTAVYDRVEYNKPVAADGMEDLGGGIKVDRRR
jgi:hypothetical protein